VPRFWHRAFSWLTGKTLSGRSQATPGRRVQAKNPGSFTSPGIQGRPFLALHTYTTAGRGTSYTVDRVHYTSDLTDFYADSRGSSVGGARRRREIPHRLDSYGVLQTKRTRRLLCSAPAPHRHRKGPIFWIAVGLDAARHRIVRILYFVIGFHCRRKVPPEITGQIRVAGQRIQSSARLPSPHIRTIFGSNCATISTRSSCGRHHPLANVFVNAWHFHPIPAGQHMHAGAARDPFAPPENRNMVVRLLARHPPGPHHAMAELKLCGFPKPRTTNAGSAIVPGNHGPTNACPRPASHPYDERSVHGPLMPLFPRKIMVILHAANDLRAPTASRLAGE